MTKKLLIDAVYPDETRVVTFKNGRINEFDFETKAKKQIKGNIYLAKITRIEPGLQAAFVDFGGERHGFLPFTEIHPNYFHIPLEDKEKLIDALADRPFTQPGEASEAETKNIEDQLKAISMPEFKGDDEDRPQRGRRNQQQAAPVIATEEPTTVAEPTANESQEHETQTATISLEANLQVIEPIETPTIDVIASDTDEPEASEDSYQRRNNIYRQYKIQEVLKRNQIILVQVIKEERGNKGASITTFISLAGRYCVLMPNSENRGGISRRIMDGDDRRHLRNIAEELNNTEGASLIIRTAGSKKNKREIRRDYEYLVRLWNMIRENTIKAKAPAFIHAEGDLIKRTIRDLYDDEVEEILVQGRDSYGQARDFMKLLLPHDVNKVKEYKDKTPIFCKYNVDEQLAGLYNPVAYLESGGYVVINHTEALIAVDVNSGKSTSERNVEETAVKTNLEAAYEIARQIRLRDLSGLIVIDFIDMYEQKNRRAVERALKEALYLDRARIQIGSISLFGLLEMSRQRLRTSFFETNTVACSQCNGKGTVRAQETTAVMILRTIETEIYRANYESASIFAHPDMAIYILNNKRGDIAAIETKYNTRINIFQDDKCTPDSFGLEKVRRRQNSTKEVGAMSSIEAEELYSEVEEVDFDESEPIHIIPEGQEAKAPNPQSDEFGKENYRKRRSNYRRNRGRRRNYKDRPEGAANGQPQIDGAPQPKPQAPKELEPAGTGSLIKGFLKRILD